jgi:ABC-type methionine transport system ATPase subunit
MSNDKEKLSQLSARVDELIVTVNKVTEELRAISASIKLLSIGQTQSQTTVTSKVTIPKTTYTASLPTSTADSADTGQAEIKLRTLDDVRMSFPEELEAKLIFEDKNDYITIKPKQFLGSDNFAKIASAVRGIGGEYISAGKDSHFRVPKKKSLN